MDYLSIFVILLVFATLFSALLSGVVLLVKMSAVSDWHGYYVRGFASARGDDSKLWYIEAARKNIADLPNWQWLRRLLKLEMSQEMAAINGGNHKTTI